MPTFDEQLRDYRENRMRVQDSCRIEYDSMKKQLDWALKELDTVRHAAAYDKRRRDYYEAKYLESTSLARETTRVDELGFERNMLRHRVAELEHLLTKKNTYVNP